MKNEQKVRKFDKKIHQKPVLLVYEPFLMSYQIEKSKDQLASQFLTSFQIEKASFLAGFKP